MLVPHFLTALQDTFFLRASLLLHLEESTSCQVVPLVYQRWYISSGRHMFCSCKIQHTDDVLAR